MHKLCQFFQKCNVDRKNHQHFYPQIKIQKTVENGSYTRSYAHYPQKFSTFLCWLIFEKQTSVLVTTNKSYFLMKKCEKTVDFWIVKNWSWKHENLSYFLKIKRIVWAILPRKKGKIVNINFGYLKLRKISAKSIKKEDANSKNVNLRLLLKNFVFIFCSWWSVCRSYCPWRRTFPRILS